MYVTAGRPRTTHTRKTDRDRRADDIAGIIKEEFGARYFDAQLEILDPASTIHDHLKCTLFRDEIWPPKYKDGT